MMVLLLMLFVGFHTIFILFRMVYLIIILPFRLWQRKRSGQKSLSIELCCDKAILIEQALKRGYPQLLQSHLRDVNVNAVNLTLKVVKILVQLIFSNLI